MTIEQLRAYLYRAGVSFRLDAEEGLAWDIPTALPAVVKDAVDEHWGDLVKEAVARPDLTVRGMRVPSR